MKKPDRIVVHCSDTPPDMDIGKAEIDQWHKQRGWSGIGYHFVIRRDGMVEKGRDLSEEGAHARGYNHCPGVCLVGGAKRLEDGSLKAESNFTRYQLEALVSLIDFIREYASDVKLDVVGHHDLPGVDKECPSFNVKEFMS